MKSAVAILLVVGITALNAPAGEPKRTLSGVVNLNEATLFQLSLLPGIGPAKAKAIQERVRVRPFQRVEELLQIKGIGPKTLVKLRPYLSIAGPTTAHFVRAPTIRTSP